MDKNMVMQHLQFGEVAAYLQDDQEVQKDKNKIIENEEQGKDDKNQDFDSNSTSSNSNNNNNNKGRSNDSSDSGNGHSSSSSSSSDKNEQRPRTFLAQYAISEIPTLAEDVSPFPDIIKTGDELCMR